MLAWVVIDRTYSRQFLPKSSSLRTLCLCVEFSDSLRPTSVAPTTYALTLATAAPQPFCNQSVTHSFYLDGGYAPLYAAPTTAILSNAYPMFPISFIFQSRAHSFALFCAPQKLNSFIFNRFRTLRQKTEPPGWGRRISCQRKIRDEFLSLHPYFITSLLPLPRGNSIGSAGGLSAMASSSGYCRRSGSGTFTFDPFRMLMSCSAFTTDLP